MESIYQCSECKQMTSNFCKSARRKAKKGELAYCIPCASAKREIREARRRVMEEESDRQYKLYKEKRQRRFQSRLDYPVAPPHPDENKNWEPEKRMVIRSGGFCFGLRPIAQDAANSPIGLLKFDDMAELTSDRHHGGVTCNTVAKNGDWLAYKLVEKSEHYGEFEGGWFFCHEDFDPVFELRQIIFHTIDDEYGQGGGGIKSEGNTQDHHRALKFALCARFMIGTVYGEQADEIQDEGIYIVDYDEAKRGSSNPKTDWRDAYTIRDIAAGENIGRLAYDAKDNHLCKAFLLCGNAVTFEHIYFVQGTAPMGQVEWDDDYKSNNSNQDRTISVEDYAKQSKTKICLKVPSYREAMIKRLSDKKQKSENTVVDDSNARSRSRSHRQSATNTSPKGATKKKQTSIAAREGVSPKRIVEHRATNANQKKQMKLTSFFSLARTDGGKLTKK